MLILTDGDIRFINILADGCHVEELDIILESNEENTIILLLET